MVVAPSSTTRVEQWALGCRFGELARKESMFVI